VRRSCERTTKTRIVNRPPTAMAINSSKSKTGLLTVLQQDQDLRPSWNIYHPRWSGEEVAMQGTYRSTRVVDTNFFCIICNIELFSTALMRTARHYLIFYLSESYSIAKMIKSRRSMSWAITRGKDVLDCRDRAVRIHSNSSSYHVELSSSLCLLSVYMIYGRPGPSLGAKRYMN
jgi:hypothetical protein